MIERGVLVDRSGALSIEDVLQHPFAPAGTVLAGGYTDAVHWLRLTVRPNENGGDLILRIRPTYLDQVTLYASDPAHPGAWDQQMTGDRLPFADRALDALSLGFTIHPAAPVTTYYLRLRTTSSSLLDVEALTPRALFLDELRGSVAELICLALMAAVLLWAINELVVARELVIGLFALSQLAYLAYGVAVLGYLAPLLPANSPISADALTNVLVCGSPIIIIAFNRALLAQFAPGIALLLIDVMLAIDAGALLLLVLGFTRVALELNAITVFAAGLAATIVAFAAKKEMPPGRRILRAVYVLQTLSLIISIPPLLGLSPAIGWALYAGLAHGMISALLALALLYRRARQRRELALRAEIELDVTQRQLERERRQLDTQNRFVAMLSHELKKPMITARQALASMNVADERAGLIGTALGDMEAVVERCSYADLIEHRDLRLLSRPCDIGAILQEAIAKSAAPERLKLRAGPLPQISTDRVLLTVLLANLLDNALKYSPPESAIDIEASLDAATDRSRLRIVIENWHGRAGLPDPDRLFQKFYRSPGARSKSGSGLGLYIVRGIVDLLEGEISYQGAEGKARFSLWLPR